jgi:hypothetical protein
VVQSNAAAKKATINRHRAGFDLWRLVHETLEDVVIRDRNQQQSFERALDLLFIQGFKSHGSLYSLCVLGHCEDAATIARRIFEIALQVGYLDSEEPERENRGNQYLAYFWHLAKGILANPSLPPEDRQRWQQLYDQNKKWLRFNKRGNPLPNWSGLSFADLASKLNMQQAYEVDYRFLSNAAHSSAAGAMLNVIGGTLQITDDAFVTPILVYGTRYMLAVTEVWNAHFKLIDDSKMDEFRKQSLHFDFEAARDASKNNGVERTTATENELLDHASKPQIENGGVQISTPPEMKKR